MDELGTTLAGLTLRNPVLLAAGCAGVLDESRDVLDLSRVGAIVTKSITPEAREGNAPWRVAPVRAGMLNAVGLANPGVDAFVREVAPRIAGVPAPVIVSIAGFSIDDYVRVCAHADALGVPAVELNVSCPNVKAGCEFAYDPALLRELLCAVRPVLARTRMFVKLSPIPGGRITMTDMVRAAAEPGAQPAGPNNRPGADAVCLANTTPAMAIDVRTRKPLLGRGTGGLSGPAVHPMAVKLVHDVYRAFARDAALPIIGLGGVVTWEDAAEFILAGASAVEIGTGMFIDPRTPIKVAKGLSRWVRAQGASNVQQLVGAVQMPA